MKNRLKIERAVYGLTQAELAKRVGVSRQTIHAIERGKYNPSVVLAIKIARVFKKPVEEIFLVD